MPSKTATVTSLAMMWDRLSGEQASAIQGGIPMSYALLILPPSSIPQDASVLGATRDHPEARWTKHHFAKGTTLTEALVKLEHENASVRRLIKMRLTFIDGVQLTLARRDLKDPSSLHCTGVYNSSEVFLNRTASRRLDEHALRETTHKKGAFFLSDATGRITTGVSTAGVTFSAAKLYASICPPPEHQQPGYDFTPMSHIAFLQRPNDKVLGVRPKVADSNLKAVEFRPRSYLRSESTKPTRTLAAEHPHIGDHTCHLTTMSQSINCRNQTTIEKAPPSERAFRGTARELGIQLAPSPQKH